MKIECPVHGEVESNANKGFIHPDRPITDYCPQCVGAKQTARYEEAIARAKQKNPNWKPLESVVKPQKAVHPTTYAAFCRWLKNKKSHTL